MTIMTMRRDERDGTWNATKLIWCLFITHFGGRRCFFIHVHIIHDISLLFFTDHQALTSQGPLGLDVMTGAKFCMHGVYGWYECRCRMNAIYHE